MFVDLDIENCSVLLCGEATRTERVALKFAQATEVLRFNRVEDMRAPGTPVGLVVLCVSDEREAQKWRAAVLSSGIGAPSIVDTEVPAESQGEVFLIGAGPGDPGLMTRHALEVLSQADVVLLDHLSPYQDLPRWAPHAEIIDVGKIPGKHRVPQREIDQLMVRYALQGKKVARLKGGDPYVFGRGAEELYVCEKEGIPVKVFSGVTSSISLPAMAGVPLTLRGVSHMFTVVSAHQKLTDSELDQLSGLLKDGGTVSILMGVKTLPHTIAGLLERGVRPDMPMVTVQDGFRAHQQEYFSTVGTCLENYDQLKPPAVTTIGNVCAAVGENREELMGKAFETH